MQALWSRSARTASCRCTTCLHSATTTIASRTTAAPKQRVKFSTGTVFYSAILATAAVADAKIKDDRRKQWDRAIAEAKLDPSITSKDADNVRSGNIERSIAPRRSLRDLEWDQSAAYHAHLPRKSPSPLENQLRVLDSHIEQAFRPPEAEGEDVDELGRYTEEVWQPHAQSYSNELVDAETNLRSDTSLDMSEHWPAIVQTPAQHEPSRVPQRGPKTNEHLRWAEVWVAELVAGLLLNTRAFSARKDTTASIPGKSGNALNTLPDEKYENLVPESISLAERWLLLESDGVHKIRKTRFPQYDSFKYRGEWRSNWSEERRQLDISIQDILNHSYVSRKSKDLMIAKVCYNLLMSSVPPNIDTFNLLIERFTFIGEHSSAMLVIHSVMRRNKLVPNERTASAVLEHFRITKNRQGFSRTIQQLRGVEPGFKVRRRYVDELDSPNVKTWAAMRLPITTRDALYEQIPRNNKVFESMIHGCLELLKVGDALRYFKNSITKGVQVSVAVFVRLVKDCFPDDKLSAKLLRIFLEHWQKSSYTPNLITSDPVGREYLFRLIARLGIELDASQRSYLGPLPDRVLRRKAIVGPIDFVWLTPQESFNYMLRQLRIDILEDGINEVTRFSEEAYTLFDSCRFSPTTTWDSYGLTEADSTEEITHPIEDATEINAQTQNIPQRDLDIAGWHMPIPVGNFGLMAAGLQQKALTKSTPCHSFRSFPDLQVISYQPSSFYTTSQSSSENMPRW
jgi:hypothetical protein